MSVHCDQQTARDANSSARSSGARRVSVFASYCIALLVLSHPLFMGTVSRLCVERRRSPTSHYLGIERGRSAMQIAGLQAAQ